MKEIQTNIKETLAETDATTSGKRLCSSVHLFANVAFCVALCFFIAYYSQRIQSLESRIDGFERKFPFKSSQELKSSKVSRTRNE